MYIIRTTSKENVYLKDLGIVVCWNDPNGVLIDNDKFEKSNDVKKALAENQIMFSKLYGDYSQIPDKNVVETEEDLKNISNPYENMLVYVKNYMNTGNTVLLIYLNNQWKYVNLGNAPMVPPPPMPYPPYPPERHVYAIDVITDDEHKFVTKEQIENWSRNNNNDNNDNNDNIVNKSELSNVAFSGDYNDLVNKPNIDGMTELADVASTGNYEDLVNKPDLASVATTGDYNDLINRPSIPDLSRLSTVAMTGNYNDLANKPNIPVLPVLSAVATSGSYNDLLGKPSLASVATTGEYSDLLNKPYIPQKSSDLELDNVYKKEEIDSKISDAKIELYKYEAEGSNNKDCIVMASGYGVAINKLNNQIMVNKPQDVQITSLQFHFLSSEIGSSGKVVIDYDATAQNDYKEFTMPIIQVINDVESSRSCRLSCAYNYNINSHTVEVTGLLNNANCWIKLVF